MSLSCNICEHTAKSSLQAHLRSAHGLNPTAYLVLHPQAQVFSINLLEKLANQNSIKNKSVAFRSKVSDSLKKKWREDKDYSAEMHAKLSKALSDPGVKRKRKESVQRHYDNLTEEQRRIHTDGIIKSWKDPIKRKNRVDALREAHVRDEVRQKHSDGTKRYYKGLTEEERKQIRDNLKKTWAKPENHTKIVKSALSASKAAQSPEALLKRKKTDATPETRLKRSVATKKRMSLLLRSRKKWSNLNLFFLEKMREVGMNPEWEYPIGPYSVDFCFPDKRIVIEADGDFWHANPAFLAKRGTTTLYPVQKKMQRQDKAKNTYMSNHGWTLMRFWETDIKDKTAECINKITGALCQ